jgi:two-component system heavy metal sensor histidine kinase CusS
MVFYSSNLHNRPIPDVVGQHVYDAVLPGIGNVRVGEFIMGPFDVSIATPMTQVREGMRDYVEVCAALLLAMLIASVGIGFGLSRVILKPLNFIRDTANRIRSDNLSERIPVPTHHDELTDLTQLLNQMFDRLEDSFTQIKRFSADASHELKTPLSLIRLHAEKMLEDQSLPGSSVDAVLVQLEELARLNQIIDEMLFLSRADAHAIKLSLSAASPEKFLRGFEQDALVLAEHNGQAFRLITYGHGTVLYEERWLRQVWLNLLTNAFNATPRNGLIAMTSSFCDTTWMVAIEDEGAGLPEIELAQVFERFTQFGSAEHRAKGSGLGLAISRSIVVLHGGTIQAANRADRSGLRVTVSLPVH